MGETSNAFLIVRETLGLLHWLDISGMYRFARLCTQARAQVAAHKADWELKLRGLGLATLERQLKLTWLCHHEIIRRKGDRLNTIGSAADMYRCWPSTTWFGEDVFPVKDYLEFEIGDSSYNIWILDLQMAVPLLDRICCDLYLRMTWPRADRDSPRAWACLDEGGFVELAAASARKSQTDNAPNDDSDDGLEWEFRMRPVSDLMGQIWWRPGRLGGGRRRTEEIDAILQKRPYLSEGLLAPRFPEPKEGLSCLWGQESIFVIWDSMEVWVYCCYVD